MLLNSVIFQKSGPRFGPKISGPETRDRPVTGPKNTSIWKWSIFAFLSHFEVGLIYLRINFKPKRLWRSFLVYFRSKWNLKIVVMVDSRDFYGRSFATPSVQNPVINPISPPSGHMQWNHPQNHHPQPFNTDYPIPRYTNQLYSNLRKVSKLYGPEIQIIRSTKEKYTVPENKVYGPD